MTDIIRINKVGPRKLGFEADLVPERRVATSAPFQTIGQLESGLAALFQMAQSPQSVAVELGADMTSFGLSWRRTRVRFVGRLEADCISGVLSGALNAIVVGERPADQRRADLSGRLCDLEH